MNKKTSNNNRIAEVRRMRGMTQQQLAELVGVLEPTISRYESAIREPPIKVWEKLAAVLEVKPSYLMGVD